MQCFQQVYCVLLCSSHDYRAQILYSERHWYPCTARTSQKTLCLGNNDLSVCRFVCKKIGFCVGQISKQIHFWSTINLTRRDEVTGEWRKLHNEELNDLYYSPNIVLVIKWRRMRWAGHAARMGERRVVYRVLVGKPEWKRPLRRPRRRWEDNIKMDLQEVGCGGMDWIELVQDRVMNLRVPWNAGNLTSWKPVSFSRRTLFHGVGK